MRNKKGIVRIISQFIIVLALYVVFYDSIASKPNHAGFWFILVLGMSLG
ncbi:MAG: hypothetical protein GXO79_11605 [Chlorobi bacterium]|nr:hypothetical protein [Chlorobiota bacterium]